MKKVIIAIIIFLAIPAYSAENKKVSDLTLAVPSGSDYDYFVDDPTGTPASRRCTIADKAAAGWYVKFADAGETDQGATGNGKSIKAYVDAIGSKNGTIVLTHSGTGTTTVYTLATSETIPSNIKLTIQKGAILSIDTGVTLTINGPFEAGLYQVFDGDGSISFGDGAVKEVDPEWWQENTAPGTTDMSSALNAAGAQTTGVIVLQDTTYKLTASGVESNIPIQGSGIGRTIIDASNTSISIALKFEGTGLTSLPDLSADVSKTGQTLTFTTAPSLSEGDVIVIYNPTDYSYSGWRTYYRAGEYVRVKSISGTTVELWDSLKADYLAADVDLYKMNGISGFCRDLTIIGADDSTGTTYSLQVIYGNRFSVERVEALKFSYGGISLKQSFDSSVKDCYGYSNTTNASGSIYPLLISNSQNVRISGGKFRSWWHACATGGGDYVGCVPNRNIIFDGVKMVSNGTVQAFGPHGNIEYLTVSNCLMDGGLIIGGNHIKIYNNQIIGKQKNGGAIRASELSGLDISVIGNYVYSNVGSTAYGYLFDIGGNNAVFSSESPFGGTVQILDNNMVLDVAANSYSAIRIIQRGYTGSETINIVIRNNNIILPNTSYKGAYVYITWVSGNTWDFVDISGNTLEGFGIGVQYAKKIVVRGNFIRRVNSVGMSIIQIENSLLISDNDFEETSYNAIYASGSSTKPNIISVIGNTARDNNLVTSTSSVNLTPFYIAHAKRVVFKSNSGGSYNYQDYLTYFSDITQLLYNDNDIIGTGYHQRNLVLSSNFNTTAPTQGDWQKGDICINSNPAAAGEPGWVCVNRQDTAVRVTASATDTTIEVDSTTGILAGDVIGIDLDDGTTHWTTVATIVDADTLTISSGLASGASVGNSIYTNRWKAMANLST